MRSTDAFPPKSEDERKQIFDRLSSSKIRNFKPDKQLTVAEEYSYKPTTVTVQLSNNTDMNTIDFVGSLRKSTGVDKIYQRSPKDK